MEEKKEQETRGRGRIYGILTVSCLSTLIFAGLYVQQVQRMKEGQEEAYRTEATGSLQEEYAAALREIAQKEEREEARSRLLELAGTFIHACYVEPDSRESMLAGCQRYTTDELQESLEVLAEYRDFEEAERELCFYTVFGDVDEEEETGEAMALFTVRSSIKGTDRLEEHTYLLRFAAEPNEEGNYLVSTIYTMQEVSFSAD